jgi:hypothetical protein
MLLYIFYCLPYNIMCLGIFEQGFFSRGQNMGFGQEWEKENKKNGKRKEKKKLKLKEQTHNLMIFFLPLVIAYLFHYDRLFVEEKYHISKAVNET